MLYRDYLKSKYQNTAVKLANAEGVPCVLEYSKGKNIRNYEVYGNSETGKNLLDIPSEYTWTGYAQKSTHIPAGQYVLSWTSTIWGGASSPVIRFAKNNKQYWMQKNSSFRSFTLTQPETTIQVYANDFSVTESKDVTSTINQLMLELGTTATEYEPYRVPVTANIYLDEPLRKIGDYADYIDFKGQRVVRKVGVLDNTSTKPISESLVALAIPTEEPIPLPALKTFKGTNIISVDTSVQPSNIKAKYVRL